MPSEGPCCDLVVVGASAGGVAALMDLARALPLGLGAAVVVVLHLPAGGRSVLADILARSGDLPVAVASDGALLEHGRIYVAPPDHHTLVEDGHLRLLVGPRENGHRPAIDPLFRTAAAAYGRRLAAIVLSGMLDDGSAGLRAVKRAGGVALVQDPKEAVHTSMVLSALRSVDVDHVAPVAGLARIVGDLAGDDACGDGEGPSMSEEATAGTQLDIEEAVARLGPPSGFTCPECGGAIWELTEGELVRYRCHVGHAYSLDSFLEAQATDVEAAIWSAVRALREKATMSRRIARRMHGQQLGPTALRLEHAAAEADDYALMLERGLRTHSSLGELAQGGEVA